MIIANEFCRWLGIFNGVSAFNNSGMSLLDANMVLTLIRFVDSL
jgi:Trk-type K+ transport system membrane component